MLSALLEISFISNVLLLFNTALFSQKNFFFFSYTYLYTNIILHFYTTRFFFPPLPVFILSYLLECAVQDVSFVYFYFLQNFLLFSAQEKIPFLLIKNEKNYYSFVNVNRLQLLCLLSLLFFLCKRFRIRGSQSNN
jgi:hypothetical protein